MKVVWRLAYEKIKIEDIKDVKVKVDLDFVYYDWYSTCDPPAFKNLSLGATFKELAGWLQDNTTQKGVC